MDAGRRRVVLVIEDCADTREFYVAALETAGYRVVGVGGGEDAIRFASTVRFDLVVMDLGLPRLSDGLALAWRLRAAPDAPPLVAVTGHPLDAIPAGLFEARLLKPVEAEDLAAIARRLLG